MDSGASHVAPSPLVDLIWLWRVDPNGHRELLLEAAHEALGDGSAGTSTGTSAALRALLEQGSDASRSQMSTLVDAVGADLALEELHGTEVQDRAVASACRRHLAGDLSERELTYWVARVIGLRGSARCQPFLGFEDEYTRYVGYDVSAIDADVTAAARLFLEPPSEARPGLWARLKRQR